MYCGKCGSLYRENSKFCSQCGASINRATPVTFSRPQTTTNYGQARQAFTADRIANKNGSTLKTLVSADKIVGFIAAVLMILVMVVPFISVHFFFSESFTLFASLDLTTIVANGNGLKTAFIIAYVAFILLFAVFKFVGKTRGLSILGCVGSWFLLLLLLLVVLDVNSKTGYSTLYFGFGLYVWIAGVITETISLCLDQRRSAENNFQGTEL